MTNKLVLTFGTRPELIKIAPIIRELKLRSLRDRLILIHAGQHDELTRQDITAFEIKPDYSLELARDGSNLSTFVSALLSRLNELFFQLIETGVNIVCVLAQGDTASAYCTALQ